MDRGDVLTRAAPVVNEDLDVQQSEAVRLLWELVNSRLWLFQAGDPLVCQMFNELKVEVKDFCSLPEEEIMDFNTGKWEPEPLDEKKIFSMEPFEKLMTRFSVYQKAFCYMAQHFELLTPIFAEIKHAYEDVFEKGEKETQDVIREQLEELELKEALEKHVRGIDKEGYRYLMQIKAEAHALHEHLQWQHHTLYTILAMLWKMRSSLKLTSWAVGQLRNLFKTKIEALAKEIVNTQNQTIFDMSLPGKYTEIMQRIRDQNDPKEIRKMLLGVRRQLRKTLKKIVVFEADYADTVTKTEFEVPQKKFNVISQKNQAVRDAIDALKAKCEQKRKVIAALKRDIDETNGVVEDVGEESEDVPRPSWTNIANYCLEEPEDEEDEEEEEDEGDDTEEVSKKVDELNTYIEPRGVGDDVPVHLRYAKPLLDRNFNAQEANKMIEDIWRKRVEVVDLYRKIKQARMDEDEGIARFPNDLQYEYPEVGTFQQYLLNYYSTQCHREQIRMEWIYNLELACKRHTSDVKLQRFLGVLEGTVDETVYHLFQIELSRLKDFIYKKANESKEHKEYLDWPDLIKYVTDLCPNKSEDQIAAINKLGPSYGIRGGWDVVRAESLFATSSDGRTSDFVELLKEQFQKEREEYIRDIYMEILTELEISEKLLQHEDDPVWQTDVSMHLFYGCILSVDETLPDDKIIAYIAWIFLRVTAIPGVTTLSQRLVEFLRDRTDLSESDLHKYNEAEDTEFESCVRELRDYEEGEETMDNLDPKKKRMATRKLRYASLRQVMDGLYSGPFVRHGVKTKTKVVDLYAEEEDEEKDDEEEDGEEEEEEEEDDEEQGDDEQDDDDGGVDFVFDSRASTTT